VNVNQLGGDDIKGARGRVGGKFKIMNRNSFLLTIECGANGVSKSMSENHVNIEGSLTELFAAI
jgi:hypothetical protein